MSVPPVEEIDMRPAKAWVALLVLVGGSGCHQDTETSRQPAVSGQRTEITTTAPPAQPTESGSASLLDGKHVYGPGSEPMVGNKVILPDEAGIIDLYRNVEGCRRAQELVKADKVSSPEWMENDHNRIHKVLGSGDLVEVLEIGPDYVGIIYLKDGFGEPQDVHGYIKRWW
jgi:hypothetical protein